MKRTMLIGICCLLLAGCDYKIPLVDNPTADIDMAVVGLWQRVKKDGQAEKFLVLPFGKHEYMVSFPAGSERALFAQACLWQGTGKTLVQLEWVGTAQGKLVEENRTFQYASYAVDDESITVSLLNPKVIPKDVATAEALAKAITDNKDNPNLFRGEMVFQKVKE